MKHHTFNPNSNEYEGNYVIVFHGGCSDGIFSAASALAGITESIAPRNFELPTEEFWNKIPQVTFVEYMYSDEFNIDELVNEHTTVYFVDVSIKNLEILNDLSSKVQEIISLDHHDDTIEFCIENYDKLPENYQNLNSNVRSGAWLAWNYFKPQADRPTAIHLADDRDRWVFDDVRTEAFHEFVIMDVLSIKSLSERLEVAFKLLGEEQCKKAYEKGFALVNYRNAIISSLIGNIRTEKVTFREQELTVGILTAPYMLISESCSQLMKRHSHIDFVMCMFIDVHGNYNYSFRCRKEDEDRIRVNDIASVFGGGGHKAASGASNIGQFDFAAQLLEKLS